MRIKKVEKEKMRIRRNEDRLDTSFCKQLRILVSFITKTNKQKIGIPTFSSLLCQISGIFHTCFLTP